MTRRAAGTVILPSRVSGVRHRDIAEQGKRCDDEIRKPVNVENHDKH